MTNRLAIFITLSLITTVGLLKSLTVLGGDQSLFVVIAQLLDAGIYLIINSLAFTCFISQQAN